MPVQKILKVVRNSFNRIEKANVLLKDGQAYNCKRFADEGAITLHGTPHFFNMSNRIHSWDK